MIINSLTENKLKIIVDETDLKNLGINLFRINFKSFKSFAKH